MMYDVALGRLDYDSSCVVMATYIHNIMIGVFGLFGLFVVIFGFAFSWTRVIGFN
jgi:hypothetical protein